jgi:kynurenine formamidase
LKIIDLTQDIHAGMPVYPGDPAPAIRRALTHEVNYCHVDELRLGSHTGTHIDAPFHFLKEGRTIDAIPVERFVGFGVVVDASGKRGLEPIGEPDLAAASGRVHEGDFVLLRTDWDRFFGSEEYLKHPFLSAEGARFLLGLGVSLVGIDAMSVDPSAADALSAEPGAKEKEGAAYPAHDILLGNGILIVENLRDLKRVPATRGLFSFLPLKLRGSDGSPVRAVYMQI